MCTPHECTYTVHPLRSKTRSIVETIEQLSDRLSRAASELDRGGALFPLCREIRRAGPHTASSTSRAARASAFRPRAIENDPYAPLLMIRDASNRGRNARAVATNVIERALVARENGEQLHWQDCGLADEGFDDRLVRH